jgi:AraC-like DNA-binding protein
MVLERRSIITRAVPSMAQPDLVVCVPKTAYNILFLRRRAGARLGLQKTAVGLRPWCSFSPPHFGRGSMLRIALLPAQNVRNKWTLYEIFFTHNLVVAPCHPWHGELLTLKNKMNKLYRMKDIDIKEITGYIRNNISNELKVEKVAKHFGYSLSHFSREFKKEMFVSASEYISALKIEQSIKNLGNKETVLKAQMETGHLSSGTYSNFFSRFTGLSPKQFQTEMDGLYDKIKNHVEKDEEGAIHYPPLPEKINSEHKCIVHIKAPEGFKGIIFVGLFDKPVSTQLPIMGKALVRSRTCFFEDAVPSGNYYILVCAIPHILNPLNYFLLDNALRYVMREPIPFPLNSTQEFTLTLRKIEPDDPPITINLPKLLKEGLENRFFFKNSKKR